MFERTGEIDGEETFDGYFRRVFGLGRKDIQLKRLRPGSRVVAGTILGRIGDTQGRRAPHLRFEIRPAGRGAPRIDPKPILDGWKLLESTAIYRAAGKNPFFGRDAANPSIGQILLMSKEALEPPRAAPTRGSTSTTAAGSDVRAGQIDRRVLATLEFLAASGLRPTVTSLRLRPRLLHDVGQRLAPLVRQRGRHRGDQRDPDLAGDQGSGSITEIDDPAPADAAGRR